MPSQVYLYFAAIAAVVAVVALIYREGKRAERALAARRAMQATKAAEEAIKTSEIRAKSVRAQARNKVEKLARQFEATHGRPFTQKELEGHEAAAIAAILKGTLR